MADRLLHEPFLLNNNRASRQNRPQGSASDTPTRKPVPLTTPGFRSSITMGSSRGKTWAWECASLILSAIAVVALIILLAYVDGLRLKDWKGPVSPNVMVSILSAIARASLGFAISSCIGQHKWNWLRKRPDSLLAFERFDDASRGPWGSFWLILSVRVFHWVAVGAVVTVALLAFEPFMQAIISFSGGIDAAHDRSVARLGRSDILDAGIFAASGPIAVNPVQLLPSNKTVSLYQRLRSQADLGMISAIYNGFYETSSMPKPATSLPVCPTANCTWSPTTTLAVCSMCNNISSHIQRNLISSGDNLGTNKGLRLPYDERWTEISLPYFNLTNSSGSNGTWTDGVAFMSATRVDNPHDTVSFRNTGTIITAIGVLKAAEDFEKGVLLWEHAPATAIECALLFCIRAYNSSVINGVLAEDTIASWAERDFTSYALDTAENTAEVADIAAFDKWSNYSLYSRYGDRFRGDLVLFIPPDDVKRYGLPDNVSTRFNISQAAIASTVKFVNDDFFAKHMAWPLGGDIDNTPPISEALYKSTNLTNTFERAASSLTTWIRNTSNVTHAGIVQEWVIRVKVEWPYITLPLLAFVAGVIFCIFSMFETRKLGLDPWKTDMIATLTHSVDAETRAQLRHAYRNGHLDKTAKAMIVTFTDAGGGLEIKAK
ncbi:hypothetical protein F5Y14DRAFT_403575 [Nemania sp. NC0429]|nr:hypothetical protein F5Y14DRAFT_403575 [Nemania sp. NC0429]